MILWVFLGVCVGLLCAGLLWVLRRRGEKQIPVDHLMKTLEALESHVRALESKRAEAYGAVAEQIKALKESNLALQRETGRLGQALRRPEVRGSWGEMQLRNVMEMAGMSDHVDYCEQVAAEGLRPDAIIKVPGDGTLVVDVKTPLDAYLDAVSAQSEEEREQAFGRHLQQVRAHVRQLSSKEYWRAFSKTPEFVIMFIPNEACYLEAVRRDGELFEKALREKVLICPPANLIALAKTVAYGWRRETAEREIEKVADLGRELYRRLSVFAQHMLDMGKAVDKTAKTYNAALSSLESRVFPSARRFEELGVADGAPPQGRHVETQVRLLSEGQNESEKKVLAVGGGDGEQDGGEQRDAQHSPHRDVTPSPDGNRKRAQN